MYVRLFPILELGTSAKMLSIIYELQDYEQWRRPRWSSWRRFSIRHLGQTLNKLKSDCFI
jgi:hypothetical protein